MSYIEIFIIGIGLSMDAFAVSVCKGLSVKKVKFIQIIIPGIYFGIFQAVMPLIGYLLGANFRQMIESFDHWIAFLLLAIIGCNMIKESFSDNESLNDSFSPKAMLPLAVATSIDALAVGVVFACSSNADFPIFSAILIIGITTLILSGVGMKIGNIFGSKYKAKAERFGGAVLIIMGIKILIEHLFML